MSLFAGNKLSTNFSQFIYAVIVIVLVPAALAFNTIFLLKSVQRDIDYELNNKALLVESAISIGIREKMDSSARLQSDINELVTNLSDIRAIEIFKSSGEDISPLISTDQSTKTVVDPTLNQLAWGSDKAFSKQIVATIGHSAKERMWLVASPIHDGAGKKIGLLNLYLSGAQIDKISERTTRDSMLVLFVTMLGISLLLINHFRFFEISLLFKKLSDLDNLKDDFINMAAHELRSPLTVISNYIYVLAKEPAVQSNPQIKQDISIIYQTGERLKTLIEDILDVSRIEQNRVKYNMINVDISDTIGLIVKEFTPQAQAKNLKLVYNAPPEPLGLVTDPAKIRQVFYNLISNAIKYTLTGEVLIYHDVTKKEVKTFVKDTGVGLSSEDIGKLFGKFSRIFNPKTQNVPGTGLGLWITKQIVEKLGGKITVESIQNQGTQFIVAFPNKAPLDAIIVPNPPLIKKPNY